MVCRVSQSLLAGRMWRWQLYDLLYSNVSPSVFILSIIRPLRQIPRTGAPRQRVHTSSFVLVLCCGEFPQQLSFPESTLPCSTSTTIVIDHHTLDGPARLTGVHECGLFMALNKRIWPGMSLVTRNVYFLFCATTYKTGLVRTKYPCVTKE